MTQGRRWRSIDARLWQLGALGTLLLLSNLWSAFGAGWPSLLAAAAGTLGAQAAWSAARGERFDWRSPAITACSLALLLRTPAPAWHLAAGAFAISTKFALRWHGKHVFNPANIAVIAFLLVSDRCWITPGQWGSAAWLAGLMVAFGALVLGRADRLDIAGTFAAVFAGCLFARAAWLGDPWTIPLHQLQSGALIIFTCFMITDPRSTPDHRRGRIILALLVGLVGFALQWRLQLVGAPLYALALLSPLSPLLDGVLAHSRFHWRKEPLHEAVA